MDITPPLTFGDMYFKIFKLWVSSKEESTQRRGQPQIAGRKVMHRLRPQEPVKQREVHGAFPLIFVLYLLRNFLNFGITMQNTEQYTF